MFRIGLKDIDKVEVEHECSMPPPDDIVVRYIDNGLCVATRRKIRRCLTVSDSNPRSKSFLRSSAAIRHEKARHLQNYYHMVHPFSDGRSYWEFFMMFVLFLLLVIIPIDTATLSRQVWWIRIPKLFLDIICCVDICVTFVSGYYEHNTKKIILNPAKVAIHYLRTYFLIDLLSSLPVDLVMLALGVSTDYWFVKLLTYLKLLRITSFILYLDRFCERRGYSIYKFKAFKLVLTFVIALIWSTSIVYLIARTGKHSWLSPEVDTVYQGLLICCFRSLYIILLVGYGYKPSHEISDMIFSIVCLSLGVVLQAFIYAEILQLLNKDLSAKNKYQHMLHQLHEYARYKQLPESMRKRILLYLDFRFEKNYYKEAEILNTLSDNLRQEITLHTCQSLIESVEFFRDLTPALLVRIVKCMKSDIYLTNDVIVRAGIAGDSMFFIASGTIAVYTNTGKEICHLADGGHFGEIALMMDNEKRIASVVAVECCELFTLSRKDFQKAIAPYPAVSQRVRQLAQNRLQRTMTYMTEEVSGTDSQIGYNTDWSGSDVNLHELL